MKRIMIVGATGGIGSSCAECLNSPDTELFLVGRNEEKLGLLKAKLQSETNGTSYPDNNEILEGQNRIMTIEADMMSSDDIKTIFKILKEKKVKLNGLVYAAGIEGVMPLRVLNREYLNDVMNTNCMAFLEICKHISSKSVSLDGAAIVAISSLASARSYVGELPYCVSKAALDAAVRTTAKELLVRKIRVNGVLPGTTETAMIDKARERIENLDERLRGIQPLGIIETDQIVFLSEFLLSDKAKFITGSCIPVNAGNII